MKKSIMYGLLVLAVIALVSIAFTNIAAATDADNETKNEVASMKTVLGAQVRLLQLEKSITRNILMENATINVLNANGKNTTDLQVLFAELQYIKQDVVSLNPNSENATQEFVALKSEAINLTQEFRDAANSLLTAEERRAIKVSVNEDVKDIKELNKKISDKTNQYNYEQFNKIYDILGITDKSLLEKFNNSEATIGDVKKEIQEWMKSMSKADRKTAFTAIKEAGIKKAVFANNAIEKEKLNKSSREEKRLNKHLSQVSDIKNKDVQEKLMQRIQNKLTKINEQQDKELGYMKNNSKNTRNGGSQ